VIELFSTILMQQWGVQKYVIIDGMCALKGSSFYTIIHKSFAQKMWLKVLKGKNKSLLSHLASQKRCCHCLKHNCPSKYNLFIQRN
jgi:hypothetical protein